MHEVVFPFKDITTFKIKQQRNSLDDSWKTIPSYNACDNPYPVDIVSFLFDKYDDAQTYALQNNEELQKGLSLKVSPFDPNWKTELEKLKNAFEEEQNICRQFEQFISKATNDMEITPDKKMRARIKKL